MIEEPNIGNLFSVFFRLKLRIFGEVPFVPTIICTKMKNRSHLYRSYSARFLIGRIVSEQLFTLVFYYSNGRKLNDRIVTAAVAPTCRELANRG